MSPENSGPVEVRGGAPPADDGWHDDADETDPDLSLIHI